MKMTVLTASLMAAACSIAITVVSCNGDKQGIADAPNQPTHDARAPQVLTDASCNGTLAITRCPAGAASSLYNSTTGVLSVTNSTDMGSGISSTFSAAHNWHQEFNTQVPAAAGQGLAAVAYNGTTRQARLDIKPNTTNTTLTALTPTFDAGDGIYTVQVYNNGDRVATQGHNTPGTTVYFRWRITVTIKWGFEITTITDIKTQQKGNRADAIVADAGACAWIVGSRYDDAIDITMPDGTVVQGDEVRFVEDVDGSGRYPYHSVNRVDALSNLGTFDILGEHAGS